MIMGRDDAVPVVIERMLMRELLQPSDHGRPVGAVSSAGQVIPDLHRFRHKQRAPHGWLFTSRHRHRE